MNNSPSISKKLLVLNMFSNEDEFRDYLAARLDLIEPGLTLLDTEYGLTNLDGAGGRIDILARDELDPNPPARAVFSMACFWEGQGRLGAIEGVVTQES
jgi:hypothetical protein